MNRFDFDTKQIDILNNEHNSKKIKYLTRDEKLTESESLKDLRDLLKKFMIQENENGVINIDLLNNFYKKLYIGTGETISNFRYSSSFFNTDKNIDNKIQNDICSYINEDNPSILKNKLNKTRLDFLNKKLLASGASGEIYIIKDLQSGNEIIDKEMLISDEREKYRNHYETLVIFEFTNNEVTKESLNINDKSVFLPPSSQLSSQFQSESNSNSELQSFSSLYGNYSVQSYNILINEINKYFEDFIKYNGFKINKTGNIGLLSIGLGNFYQEIIVGEIIKMILDNVEKYKNNYIKRHDVFICQNRAKTSYIDSTKNVFPVKNVNGYILMEKLNGTLFDLLEDRKKNIVQQYLQSKNKEKFGDEFFGKEEIKKEYENFYFNLFQQITDLFKILKNGKYAFIHGDFKSKNVFYTKENNKIVYKLGDFDKSSINFNGVRFYNKGEKIIQSLLDVIQLQQIYYLILGDDKSDTFILYNKIQELSTKIQRYKFAEKIGVGKASDKLEIDAILTRYSPLPFYPSIDIYCLFLSMLFSPDFYLYLKYGGINTHVYKLFDILFPENLDKDVILMYFETIFNINSKFNPTDENYSKADTLQQVFKVVRKNPIKIKKNIEMEYYKIFESKDFELPKLQREVINEIQLKNTDSWKSYIKNIKKICVSECDTFKDTNSIINEGETGKTYRAYINEKGIPILYDSANLRLIDAYPQKLENVCASNPYSQVYLPNNKVKMNHLRC